MLLSHGLAWCNCASNAWPRRDFGIKQMNVKWKKVSSPDSVPGRTNVSLLRCIHEVLHHFIPGHGITTPRPVGGWYIGNIDNLQAKEQLSSSWSLLQ